MVTGKKAMAEKKLRNWFDEKVIVMGLDSKSNKKLKDKLKDKFIDNCKKDK